MGVKWDKVFKTRYVNGVLFVSNGYTKGVSFLSKVYIKGKGLDPRAEPPV